MTLRGTGSTGGIIGRSLIQERKMMPQPVSGFVLSLAVVVGMVFTTLPPDEPVSAEATPSLVDPGCDSDGQEALMSSAGGDSSTEAPPTLFAQEPRGLLGYCTVDCSRCSTSLECSARGAGACTSIRACRQ